MSEKLIEAVSSTSTKDIRAIVLTGHGGHFCAGADVTLFSVDAAARSGPPEGILRGHRLLRAIIDSPVPVIAAVEGDTFGAGLSIAAASDYLIAAKTARFGAAFSKIGLMPDLGLLFSLPQRVGPGRAKRIMMLSEPFGALDAAASGLVDEVVEREEAASSALKLASAFANVAPLSVAAIKTAFRSGIATADDAMAFELHHVPRLLASEDYREGIAAFREKRQPDFTGE